jgi:accessory gene regulator protein AgrB
LAAVVAALEPFVSATVVNVWAVVAAAAAGTQKLLIFRLVLGHQSHTPLALRGQPDQREQVALIAMVVLAVQLLLIPAHIRLAAVIPALLQAVQRVELVVRELTLAVRAAQAVLARAPVLYKGAVVAVLVAH